MRRFPPTRPPDAARPLCPPRSSLGLRSRDKWIRGSETPVASSEAKQRTERATPCAPCPGSGNCWASARAPWPLRSRCPAWFRPPAWAPGTRPGRPCVGEAIQARSSLCAPFGVLGHLTPVTPIQDNSRLLGRSRGLLCDFCGRWASSSIENKG